MLESALGAGLCVSLAMLDNFTYPADIFPSARFYHEDLAERPLELITCPEGIPGVQAGSAPEPHPGRLAKLCVRSAVLK
jgi:hypothetical protein